MKYFFLSVFITLFTTYFSVAQISQGGIPFSFNQLKANSLNYSVPTFSMPPVDVQKLKSEDILNDNNKQIPWRFGENISVNIDIKKNGVADILPKGDKLWRVRIHSAGAFTINLSFDDFRLPEFAKLYIYNEQKTQVLGSFSNFNNQVDNYFATTLISGETVIIEYFEPKNVAFEGTLHLSKVTHGYRNIYDFTAKALGSSGSCNNNVACPEATGWENQIRSVCMLVVGGNGFCSGSLINNTSNDGTPYVMTANHCSNSGNFGSWIFWFNWQSPTCTNPASSPAHDEVTASGCVLKARNAGSDFCLVQMNQTPPQSFHVFYEGWSREGIVSPNATAIHHPNGDIKKISFANNPTISTIYSSIDCWQALWTDGVTEPASSGSPLYDNNYRFIGQLYGGPSSCSATPQYMTDYYGKFSVSWDGTSPTTRLKDWLDPLGTAPLVLDGFDPNFMLDAKVYSIVVPQTSYCFEQIVTPKIIIKNAGSSTLTNVTIKYNINNGSYIIQSWAGNLLTNDTATIAFPPILITSGDNVFSAKVCDPNGATDENTANDSMDKFYSVSEGMTIPYSEAFEETTFPPFGWSLSNADAGKTWERNTNISGSNGTSTAAAYINLLSYSTMGQLDEIISPKINLTTLNNAQLTFKVAYRRYNTQYADGLKVLVSKDCGVSYSVVYDKSGSSLSTGSDMIQAFFPTISTDWRLETVDLTPYSGNTIILRFQSDNHKGNNLFLDDINILSDMPPTAGFTANMACSGEISFNNYSSGIPTSYLWDFGDGTTDTTANPIHAYLQDGIYSVSLFVHNSYGNDQLIRPDYININLPDQPIVHSSSRCGTGSITLNASGSGYLYWYDNLNSTEPIGMGNSFITPVILETKQFYVENHDEKPSQYVGNKDTITNGGAGNFNAEYWLNFNTSTPLRLVSVLVNAASTGIRIISLRDTSGNNIDSVTVNIPVGISRVLLNFNIQPGSYRLVGSKNANLWRNNQNIVFPYQLPGTLSITSSNLVNRYYYFYNWEIKEPDCISTKVPVTAYIYFELNGGTATTQSNSVCSGESTRLSLTNYIGDIQWQRLDDELDDWTDLCSGNGIHDSIFYTPPLLNETYFRAKLSGSGCNSEYSNYVQVVINPGPLSGTVIADNTEICSNSSVHLELIGSTGNIQWQKSSNGISDWTNINGATSNQYSSFPLTSNTFYKAKLSYSSCPIAVSNIISIIVNQPPQAGIISASPSDICIGSTSVVSISSYLGTIQWQKSNNSIFWESISGAAFPDYTTSILSNSYYFRAILSSSGCEDIHSDIAMVHVHNPPTATITPNNASYEMSNGSAVVSAFGGTGNYSFLWDSITGNQTTQTAVDLAAGTYSVSVDDGICSITSSCIISENPSNYPVASFSSQTQLICSGSSVNFTDLSSRNPTSWIWIFPGATPDTSFLQNPTVVYNNSGMFNVSLIVSNQYGSNTAFKPFFIIVTNTGTISFTTIPESLQGASNGSATAIVTDGNPPYNFIWSNGSPNDSITGIIAGNYLVSVTDASGCFITDTVIVDLLTLSTEYITYSKNSIYPNPTKGLLYVNNISSNGFIVEITDLIGNSVYKKYYGASSSINLSFLSNGLYFVTIDTGEKKVLYKINLLK